MYRGRFAPSPTGVLHAGSLVAAFASWLDTRAHCGVWLLRIEDVDTPRCVPGAAEAIVRQLALLGLSPDETVLYQTDRTALYRAALDQLIATGQAYPCACSRKDIALALSAQGSAKPRYGELVYPGTCRPQRGGLQSKDGRAWRLMLPENNINKPEAISYNKHYAIKSIANGVCMVEWSDRRLGNQRQNVTADVGDFVLQRADGPWAYQMAVVVDDAAQGITHIVRGEDLADNTARQILLQRALGYTVPHYLHVPLVLGTDGEKLSKQNGAQALDVSDPLLCLQQAGAALGLAATTPLQPSVSDFLAQAVIQWQARWP